jgi:amidase
VRRGVTELPFLSALECGALLRERELSAVELVEVTLRRIEALDRTLGAFTALDGDLALEQARAVAPDDRRAFAGVPIAVKANTPAAGHVMDFGSRLLAGHRMQHDAYLVRRLREAGFVIVGTTRTPEFGILPTTEPRHGGPARNPWDLARTPGGSSGGSAAAVAGGLLPIAHGNDGGGSIRIPAACCGLVGLKPSRGRISRGPDSGDSFLVCDGVLTRTVMDTAAALDVLAGYEVGDATWAPPLGEPWVRAANRAPARLRIGVTTENPLGGDVAPEAATAVREIADTLEGLGHAVTDVRAGLPGTDALPLFLTVFAANVSLGMAYAQVLAGRAAGDEVEPLSRAMFERAAATTATDYLAAVAMLQGAARRVVALWATVDVLLTPSLAERPALIGDVHGCFEDDPMRGFERAAAFAPFAGLFNVTGQPAITVPAGVAADGLPATVQLVGAPLGEDTLLQVARELERARSWADLRPVGVTAG